MRDNSNKFDLFGDYDEDTKNYNNNSNYNNKNYNNDNDDNDFDNDNNNNYKKSKYKNIISNDNDDDNYYNNNNYDNSNNYKNNSNRRNNNIIDIFGDNDNYDDRNNNNYDDRNNNNYNNRNNNNNYNDRNNYNYNDRNNNNYNDRNNYNYNDRNNYNYNERNNNNYNYNDRNNNDRNYNNKKYNGENNGNRNERKNSNNDDNFNNNQKKNSNNTNKSNNNQKKGRLEYLTSSLTTNIIEYTEKHIDNNPVIFYRIKVTDHYHNSSWIIEKRYNDFSNLQKKLSNYFPDVPKIPGKTIFRVSDFASIKKRKDGLQTFLKICVNRKDIFSSENLKNFLELEKYSPELCGNSPDLEGNFTLPQGVRSFKYIPEENIIVICTCEMSVVEKAETKLNEFKSKFDKQDELTNPPGNICIYKVEKNDGEFNFREIWKRKLKARTQSLYYDTEERLLFVGRSDGYISVHSLDKESKFKKVNLVVELKNHQSSVSGIWYDSVEKKMYTVSFDKRFLASGINQNSQITEIGRSPFDYTDLKAEVKHNKLFTASEGGVVEIFSYKNYPPEKLCSTSISGLGSIHDLYISANQYYIFTCDLKGKISILDFGSNSNFCSEVSQFSGKNSLRTIIYNEERKEIITGDEAGKILIWSTKTGQPIYSWSAHEGGAVTKILYDKENKILVSGGKDKNIKFWRLPDNWVNKEVLKFEKEELTKINNEIAKRRIKVQQEIEDGIENDFDSDLSQEDDLNGWNYRKDK